jgi:hypothetical protein
MRLIYNNLIDGLSSSALTALSESGGYVITNVQNQRLAKKWKSSSATTQTVLCAFASAPSAINTIAILSHNILSGTTVKIQANDTDSWVTPPLDETITYNAGVMLKFLTVGEDYLYWRFSFSGQGSLEIGRLWLGSYLTVSPSSLLDFTISKKRTDVKQYGKHRQKYAQEGVGWRNFQMDFPPTSNTMLESIQTFYDTVGLHSSFLFCNFDTDRTYEIVEPCYCSIAQEIDFQHDWGMRFKYSLVLEEDQ